jgi:hypothetical protein
MLTTLTQQPGTSRTGLLGAPNIFIEAHSSDSMTFLIAFADQWL